MNFFVCFLFILTPKAKRSLQLISVALSQKCLECFLGSNFFVFYYRPPVEHPLELDSPESFVYFSPSRLIILFSSPASHGCQIHVKGLSVQEYVHLLAHSLVQFDRLFVSENDATVPLVESVF